MWRAWGWTWRSIPKLTFCIRVSHFFARPPGRFCSPRHSNRHGFFPGIAIASHERCWVKSIDLSVGGPYPPAPQAQRRWKGGNPSLIWQKQQQCHPAPTRRPASTVSDLSARWRGGAQSPSVHAGVPQAHPGGDGPLGRRADAQAQGVSRPAWNSYAIAATPSTRRHRRRLARRDSLLSSD
jgi:hypothetical protein